MEWMTVETVQMKTLTVRTSHMQCMTEQCIHYKYFIESNQITGHQY